MSVSLDVSWKELGEEATKLLSELIQIDTTNPPGNERAAAEYLQKYFAKEGIDCELLEEEPGRTSILARLKGSRPGPTLMLLSHTDVVPATNPESWRYPPFSGAIAEGFVWGRGALDMKSMTATEAVVFSLFKRLNLDFAGELLYVAVADEEMGGTYGAKWLCEAHPDKVRADYVLNEGGGMPLELNGRIFYTIDTVEKGLWWVKVRVKGTAGHGSVPHDDNPLVKSAKLIERIASHRFPKIISPPVRTFFERVGETFGEVGRQLVDLLVTEGDKPDLEELKRYLQGTPMNPYLVNAFLRTTCSPTKVQAGLKENVIPDKCEFVLDFRYVPGYSREQIEEALCAIADDLSVPIEIETIQHYTASESPADTDFYRIIEETVREELSAESVPYLLTGATDSRFMRELGAIAYGFYPLSTKMPLAERAKLIHSDNERIDVASLELSVRVLTKVAMRTLEAKTG
jgi:acetylornithine deacetylase/succinyl-diaminopimelate desuccinylase-like protein